MFWTLTVAGVHMDEYGMKNESLLIGGEACLWTEYADDASITPRLWLVQSMGNIKIVLKPFTG